MLDKSEIVMDRNVVMSVENCVARILRLAGENGAHENYCFVVDNPSGMRIWVSDELDASVVALLREGSEITYSAERDEDDGDMIMTKLELLNA